MYSIGDYVVHDGSGICQITDISEMALYDRDTRKSYYILKPFYSKNSQIYTPVEGKVRLRPLMSREEIQNLIDSIPEIEDIREENDKLRLQKYKDALATFEPLEFVKVIKTVHLGQQRRIAAGKKILLGDEKYIQIAGKWLFEEIAFVMEIELKEAEKMVVDMIKPMDSCNLST